MTDPMNDTLSLARKYWLATSLILVLALFVRPTWLSLMSPANLWALVDALWDDAYYYLCIAGNLAATGRSTLDGVALTNGYQPLWLLVLTALAKGFDTGNWSFFVATFWLIAIVAAAGALVAGAWYRTAAAELALTAAAGLALTVPVWREVFLMGMEPVLMLPLFVPLVVMLEGPPTRKSLIATSAVLALAFLVRLDAIVMFGAAGVVLAAHKLRGPASERLSLPQSLVLLSSIVCPVAVGYFAINAWIFHLPVPVSGIVKALDGPKFANWGALFYFFGHGSQTWFLASITVLWAAMELLALKKKLASTRFWRSIAVTAIAAVGTALYYATMSTWPPWPWYLYQIALLTAVLAARVLHLCFSLITRQQLRYAAWSVLGVLLLLEAATGFRGTLRDMTVKPGPDLASTFNQESIEMLSAFFAGMPPMQIAMGDRAGGLAYWGRPKLSLVQAEGLTLDDKYLVARRQNEAESYFLTNYNIRYWIVDREKLPEITLGDGSKQFVVVEPIQGRVATSRVPTFCFPESAIVYQKTYGYGLENATRYVFSLDGRTPCAAESLALVDEVRRGEGFRRFSIASEYGEGYPLNDVLMDRREASDRRLALKLSDGQ